MGYFKLIYSLLSVLLCSIYNPFLRCAFCRKEEPPGLVMLPFSFGVAVLTHFLVSKLLPKRSSFLPMLCQPAICLNIQNVLMYTWAGLDEIILRNLSMRNFTEEEILSHWWNLMFCIGVTVSVVSLSISKCSRGHIYFDNHFQIKPWTYYWNRLIDKKVHFKWKAPIKQHKFNN